MAMNGFVRFIVFLLLFPFLFCFLLVRVCGRLQAAALHSRPSTHVKPLRGVSFRGVFAGAWVFGGVCEEEDAEQSVRFDFV
jgi:hypothetical protein